ncbi:fatty acid hydroxylase superfamily-domain-containing protein [Amylocarpus encephaloides]|uniref:Fatty acid hydroxylase superfamily-domain-containing protein n=1 Tax=Amylocarpus encephaloides TaxID=45428 RepID=A0A9P8C2B9_9HELO|nr:fatty acid hydroxylase superfamily-domain-containing protein [Amylocarpus encephaloides]
MKVLNATAAPTTTTYDSSTLPSYSLYPRPALFSNITDFHLSLLLPVLAYWVLSLFYALVSYFNLFSRHRIHTPIEFQNRNRARLRDVLRSVILQQVLQTTWGLFLGHIVLGTEEMIGRESYDLAIWNERVKMGVYWVGQTLELAIAILVVDSSGWKRGVSFPVQVNITTLDGESVVWESILAKIIYWAVVPFIRFGIAICFSDAWQYFWHRAMHENKWMYRNMHALHHRLYVPYAFGAFYNTLPEAFLLDTIGATLALFLSGLNTRQATMFSTISVLKGVDDHGGYKLPWNPLQWLGEQNTAFHDVHHQSWGQSTNYSQLYTTFWDHFCGTVSRKNREEIQGLYKKSQDDAENKEKET